jgi:hypothetical protein
LIPPAADRPGGPGQTAGVEERASGYEKKVLVDVVAVLVMLLMLADVARMIFVDNEPQRDPVRRQAPRR